MSAFVDAAHAHVMQFLKDWIDRFEHELYLDGKKVLDEPPQSGYAVMLLEEKPRLDTKAEIYRNAAFWAVNTMLGEISAQCVKQDLPFTMPDEADVLWLEDEIRQMIQGVLEND